MLNYILFAACFAFSIQMFSFSNTLTKIKSAFNGFDYSYASLAVRENYDYAQQSVPPFFDQQVFVSLAKEYFDTNLPKSTSYSLNCLWSIQRESEDRYPIEGCMAKVDMSLTVSFCGNFQKELTKSFEIVESKNAS